jgi:hypothetical protein
LPFQGDTSPKATLGLPFGITAVNHAKMVNAGEISMAGSSAVGASHKKAGQGVVGELAATLSSQDPRVLNKFIDEAKSAAQAFALDFKGLKPDGKPSAEPKPEKLLTETEWRLLDNLLVRSDSARSVVTMLCHDAVKLFSSTVAHGHPGHDRLHLLEDLGASLKVISDECVSPARQLFLVGALLHDIGRLPEPKIPGADGKPQSGVLATLHPQVGFHVVDKLIAPALGALSESAAADERAAIAKLRGELLNGVLDHQTGSSRTSAVAQMIQTGDRAGLIGQAMIRRAFQFDVGFGGVGLASFAPRLGELLQAASVWAEEGKDPAKQPKLPLPGSAGDTAFDLHVLFYARNLFPQYGKAEQHSLSEKAVTARFVYLMLTPDERQIMFAPEIFGAACPAVGFLKPLPKEVWEKVDGFEPAKDMSVKDRFNHYRRGLDMNVLFTELSHSIAHAMMCQPETAQRAENYQTVVRAIRRLPEQARERLATAAAYYLAERDNSLERMYETAAGFAAAPAAQASSPAAVFGKFLEQSLPEAPNASALTRP